MKLINKNNEILKYIKKLITSSPSDFKKISKYHPNIILEEYARFDTGVVSLILECESYFKINIKDKDVWNIRTPLDLYNVIKKEIDGNKNN